VIIETNINGIDLSFETSSKIFSPLAIDMGTLAMLSAVELSPGDKLLDLGCGYGIVGIYAAKLVGYQNVVMSDIDKECLRLSTSNVERNNVSGVKIIESNGFENISDSGFTLILSNPPYHTDFSIAKHFIEKGFNRLQVGGMMFMVTKRRDWYRNKFVAIFGGVQIIEANGYFVFRAEKRNMSYANKKRKLS